MESWPSPGSDKLILLIRHNEVRYVCIVLFVDIATIWKLHDALRSKTSNNWAVSVVIIGPMLLCKPTRWMTYICQSIYHSRKTFTEYPLDWTGWIIIIFLRPGVLKLWSSGWKIVKFQCTCIFKTHTQALLMVPSSHQAPYHFHHFHPNESHTALCSIAHLGQIQKMLSMCKKIKFYCQWHMYIRCEDLRFHIVLHDTSIYRIDIEREPKTENNS